MVVVDDTGFLGATSVTIGGRRPLSYTIESDTRITLFTPYRRATGGVNIRITGPGGVSAITPASRYTYAAPVTGGWRWRCQPQPTTPAA